MNNLILPWSGRSVNYTEKDILMVTQAMLEADPLTQGKYMKKFEQVFSDYHGGCFSFAVNSCASALELAAAMIEIKPGDEVIIPAHTYCATAIPFARRGAKIVWADICPRCRLITETTVAPLVTKKTRAIVVVHLYGCNAPMACLLGLAKQKKIIIIEDCAQSLGADYYYEKNWNGPYDVGVERMKSGQHGDIACYSFHGQKNISTLGEGGMITVKNPYYAKMIPGLRHNGHRGYPADRVVDFDIAGQYPYNYSIGEAQCAVGITQMQRLDEMNKRRHNNARKIMVALKEYPELEFQSIPRGASHSYHLLTARHPKRDDLIRVLRQEYKIDCRIQYEPLYHYPLFKDHREANCPVTEDYYAHMISFPFYEWYSPVQVDYLLNSIKKALKGLR